MKDFATNLSMPDVYVGVRTHDSEQFLEKSLQSLLKQQYAGNFNVIVYDDASTDCTLELLSHWEGKFAEQGIYLQVVQGFENLGCGGAFEQLARIVAAQIGDDDVFFMLDSDDEFSTDTAIEQCVEQLTKDNANVCLIGFTLTGDASLALNAKGGGPHNELAKKLSTAGGVTIDDMPEIASTADSMGWTKVVRGSILKTYMSMFPYGVNQTMKVCEDFPGLNMFLFKETVITGVAEPLYHYYKHTNSSTVEVRPEDFSVLRIGWLQATQKMTLEHPERFVESAKLHINSFLEKKYHVIGGVGGVVDIKQEQLAKYGYTRETFCADFKKKIDCTDLNL